MTYTVMVQNHALQSGRFTGTFGWPEAALGWAKEQAKRTQAFMEYTVCHGTPKSPGAAVKGIESVKGGTQ